MFCKICSNNTKKLFDAVILHKYTGSYFQCPNCQFLQIENPAWLEEAYADAINSCDTGILARNIHLRELASIIIYYFFNHSGMFVDYAGGYGVFTRLMRDIGFDYYWCDKYAENLLAKGFEYDNGTGVELVTAFEVFEHLENPLNDLEKMLTISRNVLFSTERLATPPPAPSDWWYYGLDHGQHISFYTTKTLQHIADHYGLCYYNFRWLHLFTEKRINKGLFYIIMRNYNRLRLYTHLQKKMTSKVPSDFNYMVSLTKEQNITR
jgi:hypothetical protein